VDRIKLKELTPDNANANKGTVRGLDVLRSSLKNYGAGRSVVVDRDNRIIAGNKTVEAAELAGLENAVVVDTDGTEVIVVRRTDLDLDSPEGRGLALADNRSGELNLDWDASALRELADGGHDLEVFWSATELDNLLGTFDEIDDPAKEWTGMPEFVQENLTPVRQIIVSFKNDEDVKAFAKLIESTITDKTKSVWFPRVEAESTVDHTWKTAEDDAS